MTDTPNYEALCAQMVAALNAWMVFSNADDPAYKARWEVRGRVDTIAALTAYRTLSPDPRWQRVPEPDEARLQEVHEAIVKYLRGHRMLHIANADSDDDSEHYPLVDQLTSGPTIKEGIEEIENIAEWLTVALRDGGFISGNRARGEG